MDTSIARRLGGKLIQVTQGFDKNIKVTVLAGTFIVLYIQTLQGKGLLYYPNTITFISAF